MNGKQHGLFWLFVLAITWSTTALAQDLPFPPPQKDICTANNIVDKDKLSAYLLKKYPVSILALESLDNTAPVSVPPARRVLASGLLENPATCTTCSDSDKANLRAIATNMAFLLLGYESASFAPTMQRVAPNVYFQGTSTDNALQCVVENGVPVEAPGALLRKPEPAKSLFRARGKATDLYVDRADKSEFETASKASIDFGEDHVAKKTTHKITAAVGYAFSEDLPAYGSGSWLEYIPYAGANWNVVKVGSGGTGKPADSRTIDFGTLFSLHWVSRRGPTPFGNLLNVRPDYLFNLAEHSQIVTLNLQYLPVVNSWVNSFRPVIIGRDDFASFKLIADVRVAGGTYLDKGVASVAAAHDPFFRAGGQAGIALVSDNPALPLSLTTTYTRLHHLSGKQEVGYFANSLTYSFDPNKYFGVSLTYSNGTKEDTVEREEQFGLSLTGHF